MKETEALIERVRRINEHIQHIELAVEESILQILPGQSILAKLNDRWDPYLRERWWPLTVTNERKLLVERPVDITYQPGQIIQLISLVGNPYRFRRSIRNILLIAYETPPTPLLMMITWLLANDISVTLVLLGDAMRYNTQHLSPEVEVIRERDSLEWADQVMTLGWADQVFVVVAQDDEMMRFQQIYNMIQERRVEIPNNYLFGIVQSVTTCGVGACHACMLHTHEGTKLACTEGPAFDLKKLIFT
jgi:hypothetical protein